MLYVIDAKLESALENNLVVKYINVKFYIAQTKSMTLPMLPTSSNMHCTP